MSVDVECPHCGREGKMAESSTGKTVRCPGCGERFTVGAAGRTPTGRIGLAIAVAVAVVVVAATATTLPFLLRHKEQGQSSPGEGARQPQEDASLVQHKEEGQSSSGEDVRRPQANGPSPPSPVLAKPRRGLAGDKEKVKVAEWAAAFDTDPTPPESITVDQFLKELDNNEVAAGRKWGGKKIRLTGVIHKVTTEGGFPCVTLWQDAGQRYQGSHSWVYCVVEKADDVQNLSQNQRVTAEGMLARVGAMPLVICRRIVPK